MALTIKKGKFRRPMRGPGAPPPILVRIKLAGLTVLPACSFDVVPRADPERGQWIVVLGDNGTGKTTLLRAIALAALDIGPAFIHFQSLLGGTPLFASTDEQAEIALDLWDGRRASTGPAPFTGVLDSAGQARLVDRRGATLDVFAYGATRGNALGGAQRHVRFNPEDGSTTLFTSESSLIHAETWLRREKLRATAGGGFLRGVLSTIATLLPGRETITMDGDQVLVVSPAGARIPFAAVSDGYLTTLGWTIDLIARWAHLYRDSGKLDENFATDMPCVVLVDELDLHLHPRWQLDIIPRLRAAFPKTTFVVTTHNPLTLQGTRPGEVFVLERDAEGTIGITQRDITPGLDANRILTDWFGLPTTLDNDTRDLMAEHLKLLWEKVPENHARRRALERTLRDRLGRYADTSLERIAQSVIAEVLHKKSGGPLADITPADRSEIVTQVKARLDDLDAPPASSTAREPAPTWRRKTTSKPRKATTTRKTATKRKATTTRKPTPKR